MVFKDLIKRPILPAPETEIPATAVIHIKSYFGGREQRIHNYIYTAVAEGGLLIVTVYHKGKFIWRTFIGDSEYYTQQEAENPKKSTASVDHLSTYSQSYIPIDGANDVIKKYVSDMHIYDLPHTWGSWEEGIKIVSALQKRIRDKKTEERHRRIREATEKCMLAIREPVKAFDEWVKHQSDKVYVVYHAKDDYGVCSHCMKKVPRGKWKHRDKVTCPHCHKKAVLICSGRFGDGHHEYHRQWLWYVQSTSDGCCARLFEVSYCLCKGDSYTSGRDVVPLTREWGVQVCLSEKGRYFLDHKGHLVIGYEWKFFMSTDCYDWGKGASSMNISGKLYTGNLRQALRHYEQLRYIPWDKVNRITAGDCSAAYMLERIVHRPWIEYLIKEKMWSLAKHYMEFPAGKSSNIESSENASSLAHILGLDRRQLRDIKPYDPTYHEMRLYKHLVRHRAGIEEWKQLREYITAPKKREFGCGAAYGAYMYSDYSNYADRTDAIIQGLEYQPAERYLRYIRTQEKLFQEQHRGDIINVIRDYADYIRDAVAADYDMNDTATINPRDLIAAHADTENDAYLGRYRRNYEHYAEQLAETAEKVKAVKGMVYEDEEYRIAPIMSWDELFRESKYLHHCVATYAGTYAEGKCVIISIRKKNTPDMPLYTLELSGDYQSIRQCRGIRNCIAPEEVKAVVNKWHEALISKNSKKAG